MRSGFDGSCMNCHLIPTLKIILLFFIAINSIISHKFQ
jgi:hypothetical protein